MNARGEAAVNPIVCSCRVTERRELRDEAPSMPTALRREPRRRARSSQPVSRLAPFPPRLRRGPTRRSRRRRRSRHPRHRPGAGAPPPHRRRTSARAPGPEHRLVRCARDGRQGRPNEGKPFGAQTSSMHSELGVRARRRWELNPRPGFCRPLPEPLGYAAGDRCWCRWLRCRRAAAPANPTAAA